ncbi:MAG: 3-hydroxyacyl-CoA dehydrogenase family protein [Peptococcaceae bacterium]|jgi:3-hydroxybutyryl-CoA dehydrogenase|nr:3-hydroxyacyl-CoA dehydrogenase family protein [Peptococcaceae bacterium]MDH7526368.1 3-hydroxyacyl-CoA dehydrogenase family protein [Peptococcaceae bacterium]
MHKTKEVIDMEIEGVKKVGIFGAGTMGPGLAQVFAAGGLETGLYTRKKETLERALPVIETNLNTFARRGLLEPGSIKDIMSRIKPTRELEEAASNAGLVVETIVEDLAAKKELYAKLDEICPARTIFTSNTSYLNVFQVLPAKRQKNSAIAHWFAPPHVVPLVEVVRGPETSDETVKFLVEFLKRLDKVPVVLQRFVPGFVINRLLRIIGREVFFLLDNGYITPEELDMAVKASIIPRAMVLGFVQRYDFTGLDLSARNLQNQDFLEAPVDNRPKSLFERVERGELGVKSGKGFYDYRGRKLEDILRERDNALLDVFKLTKDLIYKHI